MRRLLAIVVLLLPIVIVILAASFFVTSSVQRKGLIMSAEIKRNPISRGSSKGELNDISTPGVNDLTITVVFDNNPYKEGLETAWGFSCLITGTEKTILFDTGGDSSLLLGNMEKLGIEPNSVEVVVLSHIHGDHTGGLNGFVEKNSDVTVYLPASFSRKFKDGVRASGAEVVEVNEPLKICENVYSTGLLRKLIREQSLMVRTDKGLVVVTGCAHPGIVNIVKNAKGLAKDNILLVMGGFHLEWASKAKIKTIISSFKELDVRYVGPCHCTGEKARVLFKEHFGDNYIEVGAGKTIRIADLK